MSSDHSQETLKLFSSLLNEVRVEVTQILLFWQWRYNQALVMLIVLEVLQQPLKVAEPSDHYVYRGRVVTWQI